MALTKVEYHFRGKRRFGAFVTQDNGLKVYFAFRRHNDIYVEKAGKISSALRMGVAGWAIDLSTIISARTRGCAIVGVRVKETGDYYFTNLGNASPTAKTDAKENAFYTNRLAEIDREIARREAVRLADQSQDADEEEDEDERDEDED